MKKRGRIVISGTSTTKRLSLVQTKDDGSGESEVVWTIAPVPAWLEELTFGNAGVACTVTLDENGDPVSAAVG